MIEALNNIISHEDACAHAGADFTFTVPVFIAISQDAAPDRSTNSRKPWPLSATTEPLGFLVVHPSMVYQYLHTTPSLAHEILGIVDNFADEINKRC